MVCERIMNTPSKKKPSPYSTLQQTVKQLRVFLLTWQHTRKMNKVMAVHSTFSRNWICKANICHLDKPYAPTYFILLMQEVRLMMHFSTCALNTTSFNHLLKHQEENCTFLSGLAISGNILQKGFMTSRNLTENGKILYWSQPNFLPLTLFTQH
jgi:hypothetical protein